MSQLFIDNLLKDQSITPSQIFAFSEMKTELQSYIETFDTSDGVFAFQDSMHTLTGIQTFLSFAALAYMKNDGANDDVHHMFREAFARQILCLFGAYDGVVKFFAEDENGDLYPFFEGINLSVMSDDEYKSSLETLVKCLELQTSFIPVYRTDGKLFLIPLFVYLQLLPLGDTYKESIVGYITTIFSVAGGNFDVDEIMSLYEPSDLLLSFTPVGHCVK